MIGELSWLGASEEGEGPDEEASGSEEETSYRLIQSRGSRPFLRACYFRVKSQ
jgi:hypothetical protein